MYLVKSLANATGPVSQGKLVSWTPNQVRLVDDTALHAYENRAADFTVLAGPDFIDCLAAAVVALNEVQFSNGVQVLAGDAAPVDYAAAVAASLVRSSTGANNDLTFTAVTAGAAGNNMSVAVVQGAGVSVPLSVAVTIDGDAIITLPTDGSSVAVTKTATEVKAAWDASDAVDFMTVAVEGTGAGNVLAAAVASLTSGADVTGTGVATAEAGSLYLSATAKKAYVNGGTLAQPVWKIVTSA